MTPATRCWVRRSRMTSAGSPCCAMRWCVLRWRSSRSRPDGVLVERLLEAGVRVLALHPNQVKAAPDRFRASGGKSDRFDCFVLCEPARTDRHRFGLLDPDSDQTKALKALTRAREDPRRRPGRAGNQLPAEPERFWPGPIGLFSSIDSPISLAFLTRPPARLTRADSARSGSPRSSRPTTTRSARHRPSCCRGCAQRRPVAPARSRPAPAARSCCDRPARCR